MSQPAVRIAHSNLRDPKSETDPKKLKLWLESLPMMRPDVSIAVMLEAVRELNGRNMPPRRALPLLALHRERAVALYFSAGSVTFQKQGNSQARTEANKALAELLLELEVGFNRLVRGAASRAWNSTDPWTNATFAAMQLAVYSVLHSYRSSIPLVPGVYREINWLYRVAETQGVLATPISAPLETKVIGRHSIRRLFQSLAIFHLSDPFAYGEGDVLAGYDVAYHYAESCRISTNPPDSVGPVASVDIAIGSPPVSVSLDGRAGLPNLDGTEVRYVDFSPVVRSLRRDSQNERASSARAFSRGQLRHLLERLALHLPEQSETQSVPAVETPVRIVFGLDSIFHFLKNGAHHLKEALQDSGDTMHLRTRSKEGRITAHKLDTWLLTVESNKTYRLRQPGLGKISAEPGDIIGLSNGKADAQPKLDLGLIVWARHDERDRLHLGLKPLAKDATTVTCTNGSGDDHSKTPVECLFVPKSRNVSGSTLLLAPRETAWEDTQVVVDIAQGTKLVRIGTRRVDVTDSVACYELPGRRPKGQG